MGVFPSGQWGQTVNLLLFSFGGSNPPAPTKRSSIRTGYWIFCFADTFSGLGGMTAASGRSREELLGLRPAGCACRPRHDAAAGSRDPGSFLFCAARDIHPRPPKNLNVSRCIPLFLFHLSLKAALPCRVTKKTPCDLSRSVFAFDA